MTRPLPSVGVRPSTSPGPHFTLPAGPHFADAAVVIVHYNSGPHLDRCLAHLARQTLRPRRILIVDNAGPDPLSADWERRHPTVEVLRPGANLGFAAGNNLAARAAGDCAWLALLNADAYPEPAWLESLFAAVERHPEAVAFGSRMLQGEDPARLDGLGDEYHLSGGAWRRAHGAPATFAPPAGEIFAPCAAAALYRRDAFERVSGFDESFFCYFEDVDLGFRLRLAGGTCRYVPDAVVRHFGGASTGPASDFSLYHGHRNLVWSFVQNQPWPLLLALFPAHLLFTAWILFRYALQGRAGVILRAKRDALLGLPRAWRRRQEVQSHRCVGVLPLLRVMNRGFRRR